MRKVDRRRRCHSPFEAPRIRRTRWPATVLVRHKATSESNNQTRNVPRHIRRGVTASWRAARGTSRSAIGQAASLRPRKRGAAALVRGRAAARVGRRRYAAKPIRPRRSIWPWWPSMEVVGRVLRCVRWESRLRREVWWACPSSRSSVRRRSRRSIRRTPSPRRS